ncbi:MAG: ABC transporter permease [Alphaproteobacteria bacterium]
MPHPLQPRRIGPVNWLGLWTLYVKEVRRFLKVGGQTVAAPIITSLLFLAIFVLALGRAVETVGGVPFPQFLAPGLVMMTMVQNAFANTSASLVVSKIQGNIVDVLMPPLGAVELTLGYALAGLTRALLVGAAATAAMAVFVPLRPQDPALILYHAVAASLMLSLIGLIAGIWADKFDHLAAVTNFVITPFAFLSGTFYSIERLPEIVHRIALANPFFYMIDGFRAGFIGHADGSVGTGIAVMAAMDVLLLLVAWRLFDSGYKLRA